MALREVYARFTVDTSDGAVQLKKLDEQADKTAEHLGKGEEKAHEAEGTFHRLGEAVEGLVAVWAGSELVSTINETVEGLAHLKDMSEQTGVSTDDLQFYGFVVGQVGGEVSDFDGALTNLQRSLKGSAGATGEHAAALSKLGIATKDANGPRELNEILPEVFENFGRLKNSQEEASVATALFGKSGLKMIPVLREGKKGLEEYRKTFAEAGGPTSAEAIAKAEEYEKAVKRLDNAFGVFKADLVVGVLPTLENIVEGLQHGVVGIQDWAHHTTLAENGTLALAVALGGPLLTSLGPFIKPGLKFAAVFAAVDDVLGFLQGKDSLIGHILNGAFGEGTAYAVRAWVKDAKAAFEDFSNSQYATFEALNSNSSTTTEKMIASFVALVNDITEGFPAINAAWDSSLDGAQASVLEFEASVLDSWNSFIDGFKVPPAIAALANVVIPGAGAALSAAAAAAPHLKADTTGEHLGAAGLRRKQADDAAGVAAAVAGGGNLRGDDARDFVAGLERGGPARRTEKTLSPEEDARRRQVAQVPVAQALKAGGFSIAYNDQKKIDLHFAKGTDASVVAEVRKQVAQIIKDQNREALQILAQRAQGK